MDSNIFKRIYGDYEAIEFKDEDINIVKTIYKNMNFEAAMNFVNL